jgi:hypothetical protein
MNKLISFLLGKKAPVIKRETDPGLFYTMVSMLATAPGTQVPPYIRKDCVKFKGTEAEAYDLLVLIHKHSSEQISPFVRTLTDVEKFYARPLS